MFQRFQKRGSEEDSRGENLLQIWRCTMGIFLDSHVASQEIACVADATTAGYWRLRSSAQNLVLDPQRGKRIPEVAFEIVLNRPISIY